MLNQGQVEFFWEHGYLHIPEVFTADETDELSKELDWLIEEWANETLVRTMAERVHGRRNGEKVQADRYA